MCSAQWVDVEHGKEEHDKIHGHVWYFFEIERRMRKEEMEEKCNKEVEKGWMFAAEAVRIIDENTGSEVESL